MHGSVGATRKREGLLAALALAALTAAAILPSIRGIDGVGHYVYLRSILLDGDLDFANDYAAFDLLRPQGPSQLETHRDPETGRAVNRYGVGTALFWGPFVLLVHGALRLTAPELATGFSRPYEWAVAVGSAWWGGLGLWLLFIRLRESYEGRIAWSAAAGVSLATSLGFYLWVHGSMSHAVSFFIAVASLLALERAWSRPRPFPAFCAGCWFGFLALTRVQDLTWTLAYGLGLIVAAPSVPAETAVPPGVAPPGRATRTLRAALGLGPWALAGLLLVFLPQLAAWRLIYGGWLAGPVPYMGRGAGQFEPLPIHLWSTLVSERGGVFAWHPVLFLGLMGLALPGGALPQSLKRISLLGLALQCYLVASWSMWWGGASFGNRFFISSYPVLGLGLAEILASFERRLGRWLGPVLIALLIVWNAGLLVQYGAEMISREEEVGWGRVIKNQFTEVPAWVAREGARRLPGGEP